MIPGGNVFSETSGGNTLHENVGAPLAWHRGINSGQMKGDQFGGDEARGINSGALPFQNRHIIYVLLIKILDHQGKHFSLEVQAVRIDERVAVLYSVKRFGSVSYFKRSV